MSSPLLSVEINGLLHEIRSWVEIETPTRDCAAVNRLVDHVALTCFEAGLTVERIPGREGLADILIARSSGAGERVGLLVLAHLDTVHPHGTIAGPLPWRVEGDRAFGPGIYDMKASALMAIQAWRELRASNRAARMPLTIIFGPDEEIGSPTSRPIIENEATRAAAALVVEPARDGGKVVTARKGVARFTVRTKGRASHAGTHHESGRSAIREMAHLVLFFENLTDRETGISVNVGTIQGGTGRNVVPADCVVEIDARVPRPEQAEILLRAIKAMKPTDPDVAIEVVGGLNRPPFFPNAGSRALFEHARRVALPLGIELAGTSTGGGSDGNFTAALDVPTLDGLGCDGAGAHTHDEHIFVSSLIPRIRLLTELYATTGPFTSSGAAQADDMDRAR